jgi:hypothetical protein
MVSEVRNPTHGGLKLDATATVSTSEYEHVIAKWNEAEAWAHQQVDERLGPREQRPKPLSGRELMTIGPTDYSDVYTIRLNWCNEVRRHLTDVKVTFKRHEYAEAELERKIKHTNRSLNPTKLSVEELKERVGIQPHHEQIELGKAKYEWLKLLLEQEYEEAEQNLKAVSRQVEVRKEEFSGERRDGNMPANMRRYAR